MASILDTSSIYNTYYNNINSYTGSSLQNKLDNMGTTEDSDKLMEVCKDFESYFVQKNICSISAQCLTRHMLMPLWMAAG